jgi:hypothetical protein
MRGRCEQCNILNAARRSSVVDEVLLVDMLPASVSIRCSCSSKTAVTTSITLKCIIQATCFTGYKLHCIDRCGAAVIEVCVLASIAKVTVRYVQIAAAYLIHCSQRHVRGSRLRLH